MTIQEVIQIKRLLEGNFLKVKEMDDNVFISILADYKYQIMTEAVKNYIRENKFQPTIAVLIEEYNKVVNYQKTQIVRQMNQCGWFKHHSEYEKALVWVTRDIIPEWFKRLMMQFVQSNKSILDSIMYLN